jgi:hypothetical protein
LSVPTFLTDSPLNTPHENIFDGELVNGAPARATGNT